MLYQTSFNQSGSISYAGQAWEGGVAAPQGVHHHSQLARDGRGRMLEAHPLGEVPAPGLQSRILSQADQQTGGSLKESSHQPIAPPDAQGLTTRDAAQVMGAPDTPTQLDRAAGLIQRRNGDTG